jgi:hypothetical protein
MVIRRIRWQWTFREALAIMTGTLFFINWIAVDRVLVLKAITSVLGPGINRFNLMNA